MNKIKKVSVTTEPYLLELPNFDDSIKELFVVGNLPVERKTTVLIVGSRNVSPYGREVTSRLSYGLAKRGAVIVSGLALGIDSIAHQAALEANGTTIAVLANGLDTIYPRSHTQLARSIIKQGGAIISEYSPGTPPMKYRFIARNRIVSALSDVLIIVEAAAKSGTLHTAGFAIDQGKSVYAVPGNITSPTSRGCNQLIAQGAIPVVDIDETIEQIMPQNTAIQTSLLADTKEEQIILDLLQSGIRDGEELLQKSKLNPAVYNQTLTMLEIKGQVKALGADRWRL